MKKQIAVLLSLILLFALGLPGAASANAGTNAQNVWVNGVQVVKDGQIVSGAHVDGLNMGRNSKLFLILTNITVTKSTVTSAGSYGIYADGDITIESTGKNNIQTPDGIYVDGNLTISLPGPMTISNSASGIYASGELRLKNNANVSVSKSNDGTQRSSVQCAAINIETGSRINVDVVPGLDSLKPAVLSTSSNIAGELSIGVTGVTNG